MQADTPSGSTVDNVDKAMLAWFAPSATPIASRSPFTEIDLRGISDILRRTGRESWSRIPRVYAILRLINQLPAIDDFLTQGLSDVWFPFSHQSLPASLKSQSARCDFLEAQRLVLSKGLDLEREDGKHRHFSNPADIPLQKIADLGKGGFGYVDRVLSTVSYTEYARKLIPRGRTFRKDKEVLRDFEIELATLKKLVHLHIVELVGSYTDPRYVGIIMSPVADYNLEEYLNLKPSAPEKCSILRTFFGCLTGALKYLHENRIRHKDVKPQNVLVKGNHALLTDFGISRDWSELGHSTTTGPTTMTPRYAAPEVAAYEPRKSSADIWSLGCVFLEIWTVLCGETVSNLVEYMEATGSCTKFYYNNRDSMFSWCEKVRAGSEYNRSLEHPYSWLSSMLKLDSDDRCSIQNLFDRIQETNNNPEISYSFTGLCCIEDGHSDESVVSSIFEHNVTETTNVSSTQVSPEIQEEPIPLQLSLQDTILTSRPELPLSGIKTEIGPVPAPPSEPKPEIIPPIVGERPADDGWANDTPVYDGWRSFTPPVTSSKKRNKGKKFTNKPLPLPPLPPLVMPKPDLEPELDIGRTDDDWGFSSIYAAVKANEKDKTDLDQIEDDEPLGKFATRDLSQTNEQVEHTESALSLRLEDNLKARLRSRPSSSSVNMPYTESLGSRASFILPNSESMKRRSLDALRCSPTLEIASIPRHPHMLRRLQNWSTWGRNESSEEGSDRGYKEKSPSLNQLGTRLDEYNYSGGLSDNSASDDPFDTPILTRGVPVREPQKPHIAVVPLGGITATKDQTNRNDGCDKTEIPGDNKRRTLQVEYVAPRSLVTRDCKRQPVGTEYVVFQPSSLETPDSTESSFVFFCPICQNGPPICGQCSDRHYSESQIAHEEKRSRFETEQHHQSAKPSPDPPEPTYPATSSSPEGYQHKRKPRSHKGNWPPHHALVNMRGFKERSRIKSERLNREEAAGVEREAREKTEQQHKTPSRNSAFSGTEPGLLSTNDKRRLGETYATQSGIRGTSRFNNPKLHATVEDAIRQLIQPELDALKREQRSSVSEHKWSESTTSHDHPRRASRLSAYPNGSEQSLGSSRRVTERRSSRSSLRHSFAEPSTRVEENSYWKKSDKTEDRDRHSTRDADPIGVKLTVAALLHHNSQESKEDYKERWMTRTMKESYDSEIRRHTVDILNSIDLREPEQQRHYDTDDSISSLGDNIHVTPRRKAASKTAEAAKAQQSLRGRDRDGNNSHERLRRPKPKTASGSGLAPSSRVMDFFKRMGAKENS